MSIINEAHSLFIGKEQLTKYLNGHNKKFTEHNNVIFSTKNFESLHEFQVFHVTIFIVAIFDIFSFIKFHSLIGPQGTSMCSQGPRIRRIPYKSGQFFLDLLFLKKLLGFIS